MWYETVWTVGIARMNSIWSDLDNVAHYHVTLIMKHATPDPETSSG